VNDKETVSAETRTTIYSDRANSGRVSLWSWACRKIHAVFPRAAYVVSELCVILKWPTLLAAFNLDLWCVILPCFCYMMVNAWTGFAVLVVSQIPLWYLLIKEIRRQDRLMPLSEIWETDEEKWDDALEKFSANFGH